MNRQCVTIQIEAIMQFVHAVLFITLFKVVLTLKSVDENLVFYKTVAVIATEIGRASCRERV